MGRFRSEDDVVADLRSRVTYEVGQNDIAAELGISQAAVSEVLAGKKGLGPKVLKALGYDPTPYYRKATP